MKQRSLPDYDIDKIKFATDQATFKRAVKLYEKGKVKNVKNQFSGYSATVQGTKPYSVSIDAQKYGYGDCNCYLGQQNILCKHMVALSIHVINKGKPLTNEDKILKTKATCSNKKDTLNSKEIIAVKQVITEAIRYIKAYTGPSRTWSIYQNSLDEGVARLTSIVSDLPVSKQTSDILINLLLRLDKKLVAGGVDDSDGTVGDFIAETVDVLKEFADLDPECKKSFAKLQNRKTCFGWEEPLLIML